MQDMGGREKVEEKSKKSLSKTSPATYEHNPSHFLSLITDRIFPSGELPMHLTQEAIIDDRLTKHNFTDETGIGNVHHLGATSR